MKDANRLGYMQQSRHIEKKLQTRSIKTQEWNRPESNSCFKFAFVWCSQCLWDAELCSFNFLWGQVSGLSLEHFQTNIENHVCYRNEPYSQRAIIIQLKAGNIPLKDNYWSSNSSPTISPFIYFFRGTLLGNLLKIRSGQIICAKITDAFEGGMRQDN